MANQTLKMIGVSIIVVASTIIAFFATCNAVTQGALLIVNRNVPPGEAQTANYIFYGLFVAMPISVVVALFAGYKISRWLKKNKDSA